MEIKYFKLIKTIVEEGNIANATNKLFLTQSALSHQIKELEQQLGFKVFFRKRNQWTLTNEGKELHQLANKVLTTIDEGFKNIEYLQEGIKGSIRISTECYSFYQGLPLFIQKFGLLYPDIKVALILEATHQPIPKILTHEIDLAIVTKKPNNPAIKAIPIFEDEVFALIHQEHSLAQKKFITPADFSQEHLLIHSFPLETVSVYHQFLKPHHIIPAKISAIPLTEVSLEIVNSNMGIMCLPKWALKNLHIPKEILLKSLGENKFKRTHYLTLRNTDLNTPHIHNFIEHFKEIFLEKSI